LDALRETVERMNSYVNNNGGWTYIGWVRTGLVVDDSDPNHKGVENIASENQTPHISYLWPTNPEIVLPTCREYKAMKLSMQKLLLAEQGNPAPVVPQEAPPLPLPLPQQPPGQEQAVV